MRRVRRYSYSFESRFNRKFRDFAEHYVIVIRLCYFYRTQTRGITESILKYPNERNFLKGRACSSLDEIIAQCPFMANSDAILPNHYIGLGIFCMFAATFILSR